MATPGELLKYILRADDGQIVARFRFLDDAAVVAYHYDPGTTICVGKEVLWICCKRNTDLQDILATAQKKKLLLLKT